MNKCLGITFLIEKLYQMWESGTKIKTSIMIDGTCTIHECAYKHVELFVRNTIKHPDRHTDNAHSDIHIHRYKYIPGTHTRTHTHPHVHRHMPIQTVTYIPTHPYTHIWICVLRTKLVRNTEHSNFSWSNSKQWPLINIYNLIMIIWWNMETRQNIPDKQTYIHKQLCMTMMIRWCNVQTSEYELWTKMYGIIWNGGNEDKIIFSGIDLEQLAENDGTTISDIQSWEKWQ